MRSHLLPLLTVLLLSSFTTSSSFATPPYNPTVSISKSNDVVDYTIQNAGTGTHVFTLYGDGTCSNLSSPKHKFSPSTTGYVTEVYLVKPYQTNVPTLRSVSTGSITSGSSTFNNHTLNMSGEIDVKISWGTAYNATNFFIIAFKNANDTNSVNGCVELNYNSGDLVVDFSGIKEYNNWVYNRASSNTTGTYNRNIKWQFSNLAAGETRFIYVPAKVKVAVGNQVNLSAEYKVDCRASNAAVNNASFKSRQYPHDPNYKIVDKPCLLPGVDQQYLEYTIGFYNDGNGFAKDVYLRDELSRLLDPASVSVIDSEYPVLWSLSGAVLSIEFIGIDLPGTNQTIPTTYSYDEAFTYVTFGICTVPELRINECISNEATITFDNQPAFVTPASLICCNSECSAAVLCSNARVADEETPAVNPVAMDFKVYPNPAKDYIQVLIDDTAKPSSEMSIELRDYSGKSIRQLFYAQNREESIVLDQSFYIGDLPKGIYLLVVNNGGAIRTQKIVKL